MNAPTDALRASLHGCKTLPELLERTVSLWPDGEAYKWFNRKTEQWNSYTWEQFHREVQRWKRAVAASGLSRGDRVAILLTNSIEADRPGGARLRADAGADACDRHACRLRVHSRRQRCEAARFGLRGALARHPGRGPGA